MCRSEFQIKAGVRKWVRLRVGQGSRAQRTAGGTILSILMLLTNTRRARLAVGLHLRGFITQWKFCPVVPHGYLRVLDLPERLVGSAVRVWLTASTSGVDISVV